MWLVGQPARGQASDQVHISRIQVRGNTVLPQQEIDKVTADYLNKHLDADELENLRLALTRKYVDSGYVSSGAVLKQQDFKDGTLTVDVIEGYLVSIDVQVIRVNAQGRDLPLAEEPRFQRYVCQRLRLAPGGLFGSAAARRQVIVKVCGKVQTVGEQPFNLKVLQRRIEELLSDPNVLRLNVEVEPGGVLGETRVVAKVVETDHFSGSASIANDQPPDVGTEHGEIGGTARNLLGLGEALSASYGRTAGANLASVNFQIPVTDYDTRVGLFWNYNGAGVVSAAFQGLGITNVNQTAGVLVTQPLLLSETQTLNLSLTWDYTISNESLLGQPFSFQLGYVNGHAQSAAVRGGLDWTMRTEEQVLSLHGVVSQGLPVLGATNQQIAPNANFTTVLGQAQYVSKIYESLQFVGRAAGQIATQPLYPFEQFAIGGSNTVRGYVQNALVRDDAAIGSIELRRSLFRLPIPLVSNAEKDGAVSIDGFMEGGRGWNYRGSPPGTVVNGIASVGVGMRWEIGAGLVAHVDCAWGFIRPNFSQPVPFLQPVSFAVVAQF